VRAPERGRRGEFGTDALDAYTTQLDPQADEPPRPRTERGSAEPKSTPPPLRATPSHTDLRHGSARAYPEVAQSGARASAGSRAARMTSVSAANATNDEPGRTTQAPHRESRTDTSNRGRSASTVLRVYPGPLSRRADAHLRTYAARSSCSAASQLSIGSPPRSCERK